MLIWSGSCCPIIFPMVLPKMESPCILFHAKSVPTDLPSPTSTIFPIMINKKRSGAAPSTPNTDLNAIIFGHGVAHDVRRAGKAILYAVLARKVSYCDRNAAHRKFRSKNLGGSFLSIMATERPNGALWGPVGRPKPLHHPQKSIGRCICMY